MSMSNPVSRRGFFNRVSDGLYGAALAGLFSKDLYGATLEGVRRSYDLKPRPPHFEPKATSVIQLFMHGGPSQMDLFDPKSTLDKHHGESYFDKVAADLTAPEGAGGLLRSPFKFAQHGQSGTWVSEIMPHLAKQVDDIAVIKSMFPTHHWRASHDRRVGRLWPGQREPESAGIRGAGRSAGASSQRSAELASRFSAAGLPGNAAALGGIAHLEPAAGAEAGRRCGSGGARAAEPA